MSDENKGRATSTELTGGTGFTYEDTVVAYYLAALLREEHAAGLSGVVKSVAVQQQGHGDPMDDIVIEADDNGSLRRLGLQVKRTIRISAAASNSDFRDILTRALDTRATEGFNIDLDAYGFVVKNVGTQRFRALSRLIDWAKHSPSGKYFDERFAQEGASADAERSLRDELAPLIGAQSSDDERRFYAQFVALRFDDLNEDGVLRAEVVNRLQELIAANEDGLDLLLFDRLCRLARDSAGTARKWIRQTLLADLRGVVRLKIAPNYLRDIEILQAFSLAGLEDVSEEVDGFRVERPSLEKGIRDSLAKYRLVNLSGLPGCGKSAMLKRFASVCAGNGPILFLKWDRLEGRNWVAFANQVGLQHHEVADLLAEIGSTGTPILFIDGIDRIQPDQKGIIVDILRAIEENEYLANWKVLASSRDQGLETYRTWFLASFYAGTGIGDVPIAGFNGEEARALAGEKPNLQRLLFGPKSVREIARRPFFAAVLARSFPDDSATPQTEVDLISAWWTRGGHDAPADAVPQRQRALLDLAEKGARNLGKKIPTRILRDPTISQLGALKVDYIIRDLDGGASYSFTHDIFFEWVFFRQLIELGNEWSRALTDAGEPPLLGRVIGLLAQYEFSSTGNWSAGYRYIEGQHLRPQWLREWLTAPPFSPTFEQNHQAFQDLLVENDHALLEKLLVWFQAQHTIPSPLVLKNAASVVGSQDLIEMADLFGWPSDIESWSRLLDWLIPFASNIPVRLLPSTLEVFSVWQNLFSELKNPQSEAIIDLCATWLIELEEAEYPEPRTFDCGRWSELGSEGRSSYASALRFIIIRSAHSYPEPAIGLLERALSNKWLRDVSYKDLIGSAHIMADVAPEIVAELAKAELMEELPQDRIDREERKERENTEWRKRLRAIPEEDRTELQKLALQHPPLVIGRRRIGIDEVGIARYHNYYFPASPIHEPFASLFAKKPEIALKLIRDLANHATKGWYQVHLLNRDRMGTPIPLVLEFPWGKQTFWGDWHVYNWFMGQLASSPLECAFLALSYWAFKQIEDGRPIDEVIRNVVEGNECYAVLGLALVLALETYTVSETTFPIVTCQRLWQHDIARLVHQSSHNLDLFDIGPLPHLASGQVEAKKFLETRKSRRRQIRDLVLRFALTSDDDLRQRFKETLGRFPNDLPFEFEEQRSDSASTETLKESAHGWAGLGDLQNYRRHQGENGETLISYTPPHTLTPKQEKRLETSNTALQEYNVIDWATMSFESDAIADGMDLDEAVTFAKARDNNDILVERKDAGGHSAQTAICAVAAVVIRFGPASGPNYDWAWDVTERITTMREPTGTFSGSNIPWHPANYLIGVLVHDRRSNSPRERSVRHLFQLTSHPIEDIVRGAFRGLLGDPDEHVRWVAAQLAIDRSMYYKFTINKKGQRDNSVNRKAQNASLTLALKRLDQTTDEPLRSMPPAWVKTSEEHGVSLPEEDAWGDLDPSFDPMFAAKIFSFFPIEAWCQSSLYKPMITSFIKALVLWTAERLMPEWLNSRRTQMTKEARSDLIGWNSVLGDLLARAAPFFETDFVRKEFLSPFMTNDEEGLPVLAGFVDMTVARHVMDAPTISQNTIDLLMDCVERVISDHVFDPNTHRAGQVHGVDLPKLIDALLLVSIEREVSGAARFANGDWSQVSIIMPVVSRLVTAIGWSPYVMQKFLKLCDRVGPEYPLDDFVTQARGILSSISNAKESWIGTRLPARLAVTVQRLADHNYPLRVDQAQVLLSLLDALIDLGDRRSVALEQAEAFRGVQLLSDENQVNVSAH